MTLDQAVDIQKAIDNRSISSDTLEFLEKRYYSESKQDWIRYGDMHLDHFFRVFNKFSFISNKKLAHVLKNILVMEEND